MRRSSRVLLAAGAIVALAVPLAALAAARGGGAAGASAAPSYRRDVAPILQAKCEGCHRLGGIAPFSLESAAAASAWSGAIAAAVQSRAMPPWPRGSDSPAYVGQSSRVLSAAVPNWDFHWQNAYTLAKPIVAQPGDVVRVTCRYDVSKRAHPPHGQTIPRTPRYVLWGEGTTDEMCLGILQVTRG